MQIQLKKKIKQGKTGGENCNNPICIVLDTVAVSKDIEITPQLLKNRSKADRHQS